MAIHHQRQLVFHNGITIFSSQSWGLFRDVSFMDSVKLKRFWLCLPVPRACLENTFQQVSILILAWSIHEAESIRGAVSNSTYSNRSCRSHLKLKAIHPRGHDDRQGRHKSL